MFSSEFEGNCQLKVLLNVLFFLLGVIADINYNLFNKNRQQNHRHQKKKIIKREMKSYF